MIVLHGSLCWLTRIDVSHLQEDFGTCAAWNLDSGCISIHPMQRTLSRLSLWPGIRRAVLQALEMKVWYSLMMFDGRDSGGFFLGGVQIEDRPLATFDCCRHLPKAQLSHEDQLEILDRRARLLEMLLGTPPRAYTQHPKTEGTDGGLMNRELTHGLFRGRVMRHQNSFLAKDSRYSHPMRSKKD